MLLYYPKEKVKYLPSPQEKTALVKGTSAAEGLIRATLLYLMSVECVVFDLAVPLSKDSLRYLCRRASEHAQQRQDPNILLFEAWAKEVLAGKADLAESSTSALFTLAGRGSAAA